MSNTNESGINPFEEHLDIEKILDDINFHPSLTNEEKKELKNIFKSCSEVKLESLPELSQINIVLNIINSELLSDLLKSNQLQKIFSFVEKKAEMAMKLNTSFLALPSTILKSLVLMTFYDDVPPIDPQSFKLFTSSINSDERIAFLNEFKHKDPFGLGSTLMWSVVSGNIPIEIFSKEIIAPSIT